MRGWENGIMEGLMSENFDMFMEPPSYLLLEKSIER